MVSRDERALGERRVVQERQLTENGKVVVKKIRIFEPGRDEAEDTYFERVRLYTPEELVDMLHGAGLEPEQSFGDYHGGPACLECQRYILMGRAV